MIPGVIILSVVLVLVSLIIIIVQKTKIYKAYLVKQDLENKQAELKQTISIQNKELLRKVIQLNNDDSGVKLTIQKLEKLKSNPGVNSKQKIQNIINELELSVNNNLWNESEIQFSTIHSEFFDILSTKFPDLSLSEKKLCTLIYLNFSPKEIALITQKSYKRILVAKNKLKSKLNLSGNEKINSFLQSLAQL